MSNKSNSSQGAELLRRSRIEVAPETFTLISLEHDDLAKLLEKPELSPRMSAPFMIFRDRFETTLLLDETDFKNLRGGNIENAKIEGNFRLLTFDIEMGFTEIGFLAEITRILAEANISIVALSAFSRDHLLIKQSDLAAALKHLSEVVEELC